MKKFSKATIGANSNELILAFLSKGDSYGYEIIKEIKKLSLGKIDWHAGSIYPVLNKLEKRKLIKSYWNIKDLDRPRKYYKLLDAGKKEFNLLNHERVLLNKTIDNILVTEN